MLTGEAVELSTLEMETALAWETAAKYLDLDPVRLSALRHPHVESSCRVPLRIPDPAGAARLHIASGIRLPGSCLASIRVGSGVSLQTVAADAVELGLRAALANADVPTAAVGLQVPTPIPDEMCMWDLARDCAPLVARLLGDVHCFPEDIMAAACAQWMRHAAAQYDRRIEVPLGSPAELWERRKAIDAECITTTVAIALEQSGKTMRGAAVVVLGSEAAAVETIRAVGGAGAKIVAVADESGAVVDESGLQVLPLIGHLEAGGLIAEYPEGQHAMRREAVAVKSDAVVLANGCQDFTAESARNVSAPVVVVGKHARPGVGTAPAFAGRGVVFVPRWVTHSVETRAEVFRAATSGEMRPLAREMWKRISQIQNQWEVPFDTAALIVGLRRLAEWERLVSYR